MFQGHVWHTKTLRRLSKCQLLLLGCLLVLPCAEPDVLGAGNAAQDYLAQQQQQSLAFLSDDARHIGEQKPVSANAKDSLASVDDQRGIVPGMNGKDNHDKISVTTSDERAELSVKVHQIQLHEGGTHWVELIVEALGPDGKINKAYNGGVAASLILVDEYTKPVDSQQVPLEDSANTGTERAVHLESSLATEGAVSGAVLEHQPEVQLEDLDGRPIRIKSTIVANIIPIDLNGKGGTALASWTVETDELGYARLHDIRVSRAGQHVIQFVTTLWQDTRLEVLSAPFEIVPGPAVSAVFSLKPPPRVLLHEPFSAVATLVDLEGNETANAPKLRRAGDHVEVHLIALNDAGQKATCTLCVKDTSDSSASVQAVSASRLQFQPLPLLLERRATQGNENELPSREHWGQLKVSLKAENWNFGAPQKPVLVEVKSVALLDPLGGLIQEDGAQYLRIEPTSLLFSVEEATDVKTFYLQPLSPGLVVGSKGLSQPGSSINIAAFSVTFDVVSDDPSWSASTVEFDLPSPALLHGVQSLFFAGPKSLTVYAMDSDTYELMAGFPQQQLVREGEEISYTLRLSARPRENEEITIHISGDQGNSISVKPAVLHFDANNWKQEQVVVLKVEQDNIAPPANEHPLEGSISGDVIRELALRHDIFSSEEANTWSMRGGTEVIFSVWDDDIAGVEWGTNPHYLIATEQFNLSFRLRSQPLANVSLQLHCDGTEIISQTKHVYDFEDMPNIDTFDEDEKLGQIFVETAHWQAEYSFILRILNISETHNASLAYSGEGYEVFQSVCSLRASSDDANYNTGDAPAKAQRYILLYLIVCNAVILATLLRSWKAIFPSI
ncbi:hypothetical protein, conserved [Eimeria necatrix]|uniref:Uncharacterized protein n=1 Tax=Eimeria necatrix TaxID=51315 RepID=U6MY51_9EIME|nr:hypothetical protein, conserved [Eimeria necatrix]CDJ66600.1 hypothetical protein, conserved [Eimeria necatrix]